MVRWFFLQRIITDFEIVGSNTKATSAWCLNALDVLCMNIWRATTTSRSQWKAYAHMRGSFWSHSITFTILNWFILISNRRIYCWSTAQRPRSHQHLDHRSSLIVWIIASVLVVQVVTGAGIQCNSKIIIKVTLMAVRLWSLQHATPWDVLLHCLTISGQGCFSDIKL